ncbi:hypothetical protein OAL10_08560 [Gammaproteobacteria bacterium]|nr:hypothetical protein [Gammaproteobacteria bacterium]
MSYASYSEGMPFLADATVQDICMIKFIDPRGSVATEVEPYELSKDIQAEQGAGITVALLANGFPDSENFIKKVGEVLKERVPKIQTLFWNKGNAGVEVGDEMLSEILARCQVAIAAYGH